MNINYINESVISAAVMRRNRTHVYTHVASRRGEGIAGKTFVVFLLSRASPSPLLQERQAK